MVEEEGLTFFIERPDISAPEGLIGSDGVFWDAQGDGRGGGTRGDVIESDAGGIGVAQS